MLGSFFVLENYFKGVHITALSTGAEQLWLHPHDTRDILAVSVVSSWGELQLPFPLQVNLSYVMFNKMWIQEDW